MKRFNNLYQFMPKQYAKDLGMKLGKNIKPGDTVHVWTGDVTGVIKYKIIERKGNKIKYQRVGSNAVDMGICNPEEAFWMEMKSNDTYIDEPNSDYWSSTHRWIVDKISLLF